MTGRQYIDEIKTRAPRYGIMVESNDQQLLTYVNIARRNIQRFALELCPEKYSQIATCVLTDASTDVFSQTPAPYMNNKAVTVYTCQLPTSLIDIHVAMLRYIMNVGQTDAGVTYRVEMRRVNKAEFYSTQMHSWNGPSRWAPIYTLDRQMDRAVGQPYMLYVAGLNISTTQTLFDIANTIRAEIWHTQAISQIEFADNDFDTIPELEETVINYTLMNLFEQMQEPEALESVRADITTMETTLKNNYEIQKQKSTILLPSKEGI